MSSTRWFRQLLCARTLSRSTSRSSSSGPAQLYYLLRFYDKDFAKLSRVRADFDTEVARDDTALVTYAAFISSQVRQHSQILLESLFWWCAAATRLEGALKMEEVGSW